MHPHQSPSRRVEVASGQAPVALVIGCADSRVPPEIVFDCGLGELLVVRTAGGVVGTAGLATVEYGVAHLSISLVVVLGHTGCGAIKAAIAAETAGEPPADLQP